MDTLQCAVVLAKLDRFEWEVDQRHAAGARYLEMLAQVPCVQTLAVRGDRDCVWAQFTVQLSARDAQVEQLKAVGIPTAIHYPIPLHVQKAYSPLSRIVGSLAEAENAAARVMSLPLHPYIDVETQRSVVSAILKVSQ